MRRFAMLGALALATAAALACDGGPAAPDGVRLTTDRAAYAAGEPVAVTVTNARTTEFIFGLCVYRLERRAGIGWEPTARFPVGDYCLAVAFVVPAGGSRTFSLTLPRESAAGTHRWRFRDIGDRATNTFELR